MMNVATFEGVVENGTIKILDSVQLPEHAKVYVVIPGIPQPDVARVQSPRLARPEQAVDFTKEVVEEPLDAEL